MLSVLALALAIAADPALADTSAPTDPPKVEEAKPVYGPPAPRKAKPRPASVAAAEIGKQCADVRQRIEDKTTILVCGQSSDQYRLDPDVMAAIDAKRHGGKGGALRPPENYAQDTCATVGPMGCRGGPMVDFFSAAMLLAQIAQKAAAGENVGKLFVTDPRPSEYDYYKMAKAYREAKAEEADADAAAKRARDAKAAKEKADAQAVPSTVQAPPPPPQE
jgi:hypothetical protein